MDDSGTNLSPARSFFAAAAMVTVVLSLSFGKTDVPVFLLSGQSNMNGRAKVSDLSADQKQTVDDVMINLNSEGDTAKLGKWLTLGPGFGTGDSTMGPELFLGRTLSDSMPGRKIAFIKDAVSGTYLGHDADWLPPSSNNGTNGVLYNNMMVHIDAAMKSFGSAFDTANYTPRWAGFVWLQGEFDATNLGDANSYETNLTNLISDIRAKVKIPDLPVILPMIDVQNRWTYNSQIRAADVAVKQKLKNVDTMDTRGLPTDGEHYITAGQVTIGRIAALRWLSMHYNYGGAVLIAHRFCEPLSSQLRPQTISAVNVFDLSGRKIRSLNNGFEKTLKGPLAHHCFFIFTINQPGGPPRPEKLAKAGDGK